MYLVHYYHTWIELSVFSSFFFFSRLSSKCWGFIQLLRYSSTRFLFFFFLPERIAKKPICLHSSIVVLFLKHVLYSMQWFFSIRIKFKIYSSIRFVRFVSTPEVLERVNTIESEMLQIDEAIAIQSSENPGLNTVSVWLDQILIFFISKKESSPFLLFVAGRRSSVKIQRKHWR